MITVLDVLTKSTEHLSSKGINGPRRQAEEVLSDALGIPRLQLYLEFDRPLVEKELTACREALTRRAKGEPSQYIRGFVDFYDCKISVTPDVLIPRQETEILVDLIAKEIETGVLWDVCCGSGCIGIALKKKHPGLSVTLSDISTKALDIAKKNIEENEVDVTCLEGDLLAPFTGLKADFIVCNPPYVTENDYRELEPEVKDHEPKQALVSGPTGLEIYERLAHDLPKHLNPGGKVWFEIGNSQGNALKNLFSNPIWKKTLIKKDWAGHDRFFLLEIE